MKFPAIGPTSSPEEHQKIMARRINGAIIAGHRLRMSLLACDLKVDQIVIPLGFYDMRQLKYAMTMDLLNSATITFNAEGHEEIAFGDVVFKFDRSKR